LPSDADSTGGQSPIPHIGSHSRARHDIGRPFNLSGPQPCDYAIAGAAETPPYIGRGHRAINLIDTTLGMDAPVSVKNVLVFLCIFGSASSRLIESLLRTTYIDTLRRLRSAVAPTLLFPITRGSTLGDRAFSVAAPHAWIGLQVAVIRST